MPIPAYYALRRAMARGQRAAAPYWRRFLTAFDLPRYYFKGMNWEACTASRVRVAGDLLHLFFRLKTYPDGYSLCRMWEVERTDLCFYYGALADPWQRYHLEASIQRPEYGVTFGDKEVAQHLCAGLNLPVPAFLGCVDPKDEVARALREALARSPGKRLVAKPVRGTHGRSVFLVSEDGGRAVFWDGDRPRPVEELVLRERCILQEALVQHPEMGRMHPDAVNTVRLQTFLTDEGEVIFMGAFVRFGRDHAHMDNMKSGGMGAGVDLATGRLHPRAVDMKGHALDRHPDSGIPFDGFQIPHWGACLELAKRAQAHFSWYRLVGFDFAITERGPVIIEINPIPDNMVLEATSGPVLARPEVARAFLRHGLLINGPARALAARLG